MFTADFSHSHEFSVDGYHIADVELFVTVAKMDDEAVITDIQFEGLKTPSFFDRQAHILAGAPEPQKKEKTFPVPQEWLAGLKGQLYASDAFVEKAEEALRGAGAEFRDHTADLRSDYHDAV